LCDGCELISFLPLFVLCDLRPSQCRLSEALLHRHRLLGVDAAVVSLYHLLQLCSQFSARLPPLRLRLSHRRLDVAGVVARQPRPWRLHPLDNLRNRTRW
jgi:hypothetical protein